MARLATAAVAIALVFPAAASADSQLVDLARDGTSAGSVRSADGSPNGRYGIYWSAATVLTSEGDREQGGWFVHDMQTGSIVRASKMSDGFQGYTGAGFGGAVADDGTAVFILAETDHSPPGQPPDPSHVYPAGLYVWHGDAASLVVQGEIDGPVAISGNGAVAVYRDADALYAVATSGGAPIPVSASNDGVVGTIDVAESWFGISDDGRRVAFTSFEPLAGPVPERRSDVFLKDLATGRIESATGLPQTGAGSGVDAALSGNGLRVGFVSPMDLPGAQSDIDVFVRDLPDGALRTASLDSNGLKPELNDTLSSPSMSSDGDLVGFFSFGTGKLAGADSAPGVYMKQMSSGAIVNAFPFAATTFSGPFQARIKLTSDGRKAWLRTNVALSPADDDEFDLYLVDLDQPAATCPTSVHWTPRPLSALEKARIEATQHAAKTRLGQLRDIAKAERRASKLRGRRGAVVRRALARVQREALLNPPAKASASPPPELVEMLKDGSCKALDDAEEHITAVLERRGKGDQATLVKKLGLLRKVLTGEASIPEREELMKAELTDLVERLGGRKEYATVINEVYKKVQGHLYGPKDDNPKFAAFLRKGILAAAKKLGGDEAKELTERVLLLRDVMKGDLDPEHRAEALEESVSNLAKRLVGEKILTLPQVRAAVLGFEIGRALGKRISADLQIIADRSLVAECATALRTAQGESGTPDYSKPTVAVINDKAFHAGWRCVILKDAFVDGQPGGMVQATRPPNAGIIDRIFWRVTTSSSVVYFDPRFSN